MSNRNIAIAAVTALAMVGAYFYFSKSSKSSGYATLPALSEEQVLDILNALLQKVKVISARMITAAENIKQQIQAQGQSVDDRMIMKMYILPHFKSQFGEVQAIIFDKYNVEEEEVEDAVTQYIEEGNEEIREAANKIRKIYREFGGECDLDEDDEVVEEGSSESISLEQLLALIAELSEIISEKTGEYAEAFIAANGQPTDASSLEAFQQGMMALSDSAEKAVLSRHNISAKAFQNSIVENQNSPALQQAFMMLQYANQMKLKELGFGM